VTAALGVVGIGVMPIVKRIGEKDRCHLAMAGGPGHPAGAVPVIAAVGLPVGVTADPPAGVLAGTAATGGYEQSGIINLFKD
jgi:hypothetical protein